MAWHVWNLKHRTQGSSLAGIILFLQVPSALAEANTSSDRDKSQYNLVHPTPRTLLRELSTDRPDKTESPYTVDAGHFQIEMDLFTYTYDRETSSSVNRVRENYSIASMNLKIGLLNNTDLQLLLEPCVDQYTKNRATGVVDRSSGFGDLVTRIKVNLWGNDGGHTALASMPFIKFPTAQDNLGNNAIEGGIILPLAARLPQSWNLGVMTEFDFNENSNDDNYHAEFVNSITFSHDLFGALTGYMEFFSLVSDEDGSDWIDTADFGFTYGIGPDTQLDAGINIGVTEAADDWNPFIGLTMRF